MTMIKRQPEPFLWLLFSAGGVVSALLMPMTLLLLGLAFPLGWIQAPDYAHVSSLLGHPLTRIALFAGCALSLVHAAHRLRYTLYDGLQIKHLNEFIALLCYGGSIVGIAAAAYLLLTVG